MEIEKPRQVRARITRVVTELAVVKLDRGGSIEELIEVIEEIETVEIDLRSIDSVMNYHD